jgi:hypothetical protein
MMIADTEDGRRTRPLMRLAGLVALIAGVAIVGQASGAVSVTADELREWVQGFSRLGPLVFIGLFVVLNTLGLPVPVLGAVGGAAFGLFEGAAVTLSAMWVTPACSFCSHVILAVNDCESDCVTSSVGSVSSWSDAERSPWPVAGCCLGRSAS